MSPFQRSVPFRVAFVSPPVSGPGEYPLLLQNRQFKYTRSGSVRIYPLIPAHFVTNCHAAGFKTLFLDAAAENLSPMAFMKRLVDFSPGFMIIETKAPVLARHGAFLRHVRTLLPGTWTAVAGDHVTFDPGGSLALTSADFAVSGGDWDIYAPRLAAILAGIPKTQESAEPGPFAGLETRSSPGGPETCHSILPPGVLGRWPGHDGGPPDFTADLGALPWIRRDLTGWQRYGEAYLRRPVAYILSGRGCGGRGPGETGSCVFCVWQHTLWDRLARLRPPEDVAAEVAFLYRRFGVAEIFDDNDAGPCWDGAWLETFASRLGSLGVRGRVAFSCNARADSLDPGRVRLMKAAGFRLLKVGLESGSDRVMARLGKAESVETIVKGVKLAKDHGLRVLLTTMIGYPWEDSADVAKTLEVARELLNYKAGFGDSLQASVCMPYPGTPLWSEALRQGWFETDPGDLSALDMSGRVMRTTVDTTTWVRRLWRLHFDPRFMIRSLLTMRDPGDFGVAARGVYSLIGHLRDYAGRAAEVGESTGHRTSGSRCAAPAPWLNFGNP